MGPTYVILRIGLTQGFFSPLNGEVPKVGGALKAAFDDLGGRFGIRVIGAFEDDLTQVGVTTGSLWTSCRGAGPGTNPPQRATR